MKMKINKFFIISIVFVVLGVIGYFTINSYIASREAYYLGMQNKLLKAKYDTTYKYFKIMTNDIYKMYSQNEKLINLFSKANINIADTNKENEIRKQLYNSIKRNYKRLNRMGISQVNFYLKNNIVFLRMNNPAFFGDDVSGVKPSVFLANKTQKSQEGFEACDFMVGLRFVYPAYNYKHEHIGSIEISYSSKQLLKNITDNFIFDSHILISKSLAKGTIVQKESNNYKESWEASGYYIEEYTHKKLGDENFYAKLNNKNLRSQIASCIKTKKSFSLNVEYNYKNIILTFLPLVDAKGVKNISYIVTYTESDYLSNLKIEKDYIKALFFTIISLLYLFTLYVVSNQEKLKSLALYDSLTKLPNRTLFMIELKQELNRAYRHKEKMALMFLDLDGFKNINDTYGHQMGDELLAYVSKLITSNLRKSDLMARLGGDEFTVILGDIADEKSVVEIAQHFIDELNKDIVINQKVLHIGVSIGIAIYPQDAKDPETLIKYADAMMYESKNKGKNQVTLYRKENV